MKNPFVRFVKIVSKGYLVRRGGGLLLSLEESFCLPIMSTICYDSHLELLASHQAVFKQSLGESLIRQSSGNLLCIYQILY